MLADLHIHTYFSDGTQSPEEVVEAAGASGLSVVSICDHNTIAAYTRLRAACEKAGIRLIQGAELDVYWGGESLHLLAYNFAPENKPMLELLSRGQTEYDLKGIRLIESMKKDFQNISLADYMSYAQPLGRGGWKSINYIYDRGLSESVADSMKYSRRYPAYRPDFCEIEDACRIIREAGGVPVLAHPGIYWEDKIDELPGILERLRPAGIGGIECYYPCHSVEFTSICVDFCVNNGFCVTCGGDGHGDFFRMVDGVVFDIGVNRTDTEKLDLKGIL